MCSSIHYFLLIIIWYNFTLFYFVFKLGSARYLWSDNTHYLRNTIVVFVWPQPTVKKHENHWWIWMNLLHSIGILDHCILSSAVCPMLSLNFIKWKKQLAKLLLYKFYVYCVSMSHELLIPLSRQLSLPRYAYKQYSLDLCISGQKNIVIICCWHASSTHSQNTYTFGVYLIRMAIVFGIQTYPYDFFPQKIIYYWNTHQLNAN